MEQGRKIGERIATTNLYSRLEIATQDELENEMDLNNQQTITFTDPYDLILIERFKLLTQSGFQQPSQTQIISHTFDILLEFNISVDPESFELNFHLQALPFLHGADPFADLSTIRRMLALDSPDSQLLCKYFTATGVNEITARIKHFQYESFKITGINNVTFTPNIRAGIITGDYTYEYLQGQQTTFRYSKKIPEFLSLVDLLCRNKTSTAKEKIDEQLQFQDETYDLKLSIPAKIRIKEFLSALPCNQRLKDIEKLQRYWTVANDVAPSTPLQSHWTSTAYQYIHRFITWLSSSISGTWLQPVEPPSSEMADTPTPAMLAAERLAVVNRLKADSYPDIAAHKQDLKRLFELRPYYQPDNSFAARIVNVKTATQQFWRSMNEPQRWLDPDINETARQLFIQNLLLSDEILADIELLIRQAGFKINDIRMAALLGSKNFSFYKVFLNAGLIDFYAYYREHAHFTSNPFWHHAKQSYKAVPAPEKDTNQLFFNAITQENYLRKLYNTFIIQGFYQCYGNKEIDAQRFAAVLKYVDERHVKWTPLDSLKKERSAETWGEFFNRIASGNFTAPTHTRYTYSHPIYHKESF